MQQLLLLEEVIKNKNNEINSTYRYIDNNKKQITYAKRYISAFKDVEHLFLSVKQREDLIERLTAEIDAAEDYIKELEEHKKLWINVLKSVKCAYEFRNLSKTITAWRIFTLESAKEMSPRLREFLNVNAEE